MRSVLKAWWLVLGVLLAELFPQSVGAAPEFSGMTEIRQPNGVAFRGYWWGDEFAMTYETVEGYRYVPKDGWCYYAVLNDRGEFAPSPWKVGIDDPVVHGMVKGLERSAARQSEIQEERAQRETWGTKERRAAKVAATPSTIYLGVILAEFSNVTSTSHRTGGPYQLSVWNRMFFGSGNDWVGTSPHPEGQEVFGSFKQYYSDQSNGAFTLSGDPAGGGGILNPVNNGVPVWVHLQHTKGYYDSLGYWGFVNDVLITAAAPSYNIDTTTSSTRKLTIVYAGNMYREAGGVGGLHPQYGGPYYIMSERWYAGVNKAEHVNATFSHIGVHAHEFGHLLGMRDKYGLPEDFGRWGLMAHGNNKGKLGSTDTPPDRGSNPAPINPYSRFVLGWLSLQEVTVDREAEVITFTDPINVDVYKIGIAVTTTECFLVENRQVGTGWNRFLTDTGTGGLLIWYIRNIYPNRLHDEITDLVEADGSNTQTPASESGDVWPGTQNKRLLTDYTSPSSRRNNGTESKVVVNDISNSATTMAADLLYNVRYVAAGGSIQQEINNATGGQTVFVRDSGTYSGQVTMRSGINLMGGPGTVTVSNNSGTNTAGVFYNVNDIFIKGTNFAGGGRGLDIQNSTALEIKNATLSQTYTGADGPACVQVVGGGNTIHFRNCTFDGEINGLYLDNTNPTLHHSRLQNNYRGVYGTNGAQGDFDPTDGFSDTENNTIQNNTTENIKYMATGGTVDAQNIWWGTTDTTAIKNKLVHYGSPDWIVWRPHRTSAVPKPVVGGGDREEAAWQRYQEGEAAWKTGDAVRAIGAFREVVERYADTPVVRWALYGLSQVWVAQGRDTEAVAYLEGVAGEQRGMELGAQARYLTLQHRIRQGTGTQVPRVVTALVQAFPSSYYAAQALLTEGVWWLYGTQNPIQAQAVFQALIARYPTHEATEVAQVYLTAGVGTEPGLQPLPAGVEIFGVETMPNPFNPQTTIAVTLPRATEVTLVIYNTLGQAVRTLVEAEQLPAGRHIFQWDGRNIQGREVASGLYLYRVIAGADVAVRKLMVLR